MKGAKRPSPVERIGAAYRRVADVARPDVWIHLVAEADAVRAAEAVERRLAAGEHLPLAGATLAVKDNIDVAGLPTTAGCPQYAYTAAATAPAVSRVLEAGAVLLGKTNLDQFATGLVGTRSPYGVCANAIDPAFISGGSSSGSAVAVALGLADVALGTDTAGSGRVPAAFNGVIGLKPTRGIVSARCVVPACRSLDCVSLFASDAELASAAFDRLVWYDPDDPFARPCAEPLDGPVRRIAVPRADQLDFGGDLFQARSWAAARDRLHQQAEVIEVDLGPFFAAGDLLYGGALVAERFAAVGEFVAAHRDAVDPTVGAIIAGAAAVPAHRLAADLVRLAELRRMAETVWTQADVLVTPTTPTIFTIEEVLAEPLATNTVLGRYTTFANPLDLCAYAAPAPRRADGLPFGLTFYGPAFADGLVARAGRRFLASGDRDDEAVSLVVAGAHLRGQPLNHQLVELGARLGSCTRTAARYRLFALATDPPKPGLVRTGEGERGGGVEVEEWRLSPAAFAAFVAAVPPPLAIGQVELADGRTAPGFVCTPDALAGAVDITDHGGWRAYLRSR